MRRELDGMLVVAQCKVKCCDLAMEARAPMAEESRLRLRVVVWAAGSWQLAAGDCEQGVASNGQ